MQRVVFLILLVIQFVVVHGQQNLSADEIIEKVIEFKSKNDLKKVIPSHQYNSYNKLIFSLDKSLVKGKIDSVFEYKRNEKIFKKLDSTDYFFKQEIDDKHFYISEKISEHLFANQQAKENILAVKMAGFKEPIYEFVALGITNVSFYDKRISILGTDYVSPLANNPFKDYNFTLLKKDSESSNYIIKYNSINRKKSVGLEGELHIDKNSFALTKTMANIVGKINIFVEQDFSLFKETNTWFADKATIFLRRGESKKSIKAFRKLIGYDTNYFSNQNINPEDVTYILINTERFNLKSNPNIKIAKSEFDAEIKSEAINRTSSVWKTFDKGSTNTKDLNTYTYIDSLVQERKIERKLNVLRKFLDGKYATRILDIDLSQVANFNNHEGFRLGFGGETNHNLSRKFKLNGYAAYGNKDKEFKFHYGADIKLNQATDTWFGASYTNDIFEAGKPKLLFEEPNFSLVNPRNLNISQFYTYKVTEAHLHHNISPRLNSKLQFDFGDYVNEFNYTFISPTKLFSNYNLTKLTFALQWTPQSKYLKSPKGNFTIKESFPKLSLELTKSFDNILDGDFNYSKLNLSLEHQIKTIKSGSTEFLVKAGFLNGEAPLSHLYNVTPNHSLINPWRARINFSGTNAFETMLFNEFISDKFVSIQARQNFEKFRIGKKFKPKLSIITRFAIGDIENPQFHNGVNFSSMDKGYFESGLVLNQLFYGFGVSSFYRYGAYHFSKEVDNIAVKITYVIDLF